MNTAKPHRRFLSKLDASLQASFDPPGLTVAVKRDRAVENLLNGGSQFVVNILAEGDHKGLMKQLLKPFKPGEDRFAGLEIQVSCLENIIWLLSEPRSSPPCLAGMECQLV